MAVKICKNNPQLKNIIYICDVLLKNDDLKLLIKK